jgi:predicted extracellular nuclease
MARTKSINFPNTEGEMLALFDKLQRATVNTLLVSGALAIHGSASAVVKTGSIAYAMVDSVLVKLAAADLPALVGTVTNGNFNVFVFTVNASGTTKTYAGTQASTIGGVVFPTTADGEVPLGFVIINPTGTGNFVGGTTALDDATVVPNAVYVNTLGEFFPQFSTL